MTSLFKQSIINHSKDFTASGSYRTVTRKSGFEIITVSDGEIRITNLNKKNFVVGYYSITRNLPFQPIEIIMNGSEQLLCVYDQSHCWLFSLNKEGSNIPFTATYKLDLNLKKNESIIQVIFNNVSKFQAEIVMLTTNEIKSYNINRSLDKPVQRYDFKTEYEQNITSNSYDIGYSIVDPVSICFASCQPNSSMVNELLDDFDHHNPQNDLTLFLLTSDSSIYSIYPFFPYELSVSKEWLADLFDSTSLIFKSTTDNVEQSKLLTSVKVSALLAQSSIPDSIIVKSALPSMYTKGKITGPISMESFSEELYAFDAIKLLSLPNDILVIIFNHSIVAFNRSSSMRMIFEYQKIESDDNLLLLDTILFDGKEGSICTATVHPVTHDSILLIGSNGSLIQVDFSQWMDSLSLGLKTGDLSEFNELCQSEKLPTEVIKLGKMHLFEEKSSLKTEVTLRCYENNIWFAWNTRDVYAMAIKSGDPDVMSIFLISTENNTVDDSEDLNEFEKKKNNNIENHYKSLLVGDFKTEVFPQITESLTKITELNNLMKKFPTTILDEHNTSAKDLKTVHSLTEMASSGQLILFKVLSILSKRLKMMSMEYHNQINTYNSIMLKKEKILGNFFKLKNAFADALERQNDLDVRMAKLMSDTELLESKNKMKSISISYQENAYFKELARIRDYTVKKESEMQDLKKLLDDVKSAELGILMKNKETVLNEFDNRRTLHTLKRNLEAQNKFIEFLVDRLKGFDLK